MPLPAGLGIAAVGPGSGSGSEEIASAVTGDASPAIGWSIPSTVATWELVLVTLLFVLLTVLFALRLWAALSRASADGSGKGRTGGHSKTGSTGTESATRTQTERYARSASATGDDPTRHELSAEPQSDPNFGPNPDPGLDSDSDFDPRSIPRDVLPESLSDEDRVLRMLAANDGRLRQQVIVERTDWSKSKVSRLLSKMNEKGSIEKISVGRENVITFPSDDPADEPLGETR